MLVAAGMAAGAGIMAYGAATLTSHKLAMSSGPEPVTVFLSRDGGRITGGIDDARRRESSSLANQGLGSVDLAAFSGSDKAWDALVACVEQRYDGYDVTFVTEAPARGEYVLAMIGGPPSQLRLADNVGGLAPHNGSVISDAVVFVFQTPASSVSDLCQTTAHEVGHAVGLDHTRLCSDVMSYESCGPKRFRDAYARCGEWDARDCDLGGAHQNSDAILASAVGRRGLTDSVAGLRLGGGS